MSSMSKLKAETKAMTSKKEMREKNPFHFTPLKWCNCEHAAMFWALSTLQRRHCEIINGNYEDYITLKSVIKIADINIRNMRPPRYEKEKSFVVDWSLKSFMSDPRN